MYSSRYLFFAAVFATVVAVSGCKRDFKAPEPKAAIAGTSLVAADSEPRSTLSSFRAAPSVLTDY